MNKKIEHILINTNYNSLLKIIYQIIEAKNKLWSHAAPLNSRGKVWSGIKS